MSEISTEWLGFIGFCNFVLSTYSLITRPSPPSAPDIKLENLLLGLPEGLP